MLKAKDLSVPMLFFSVQFDIIALLKVSEPQDILGEVLLGIWVLFSKSSLFLRSQG